MKYIFTLKPVLIALLVMISCTMKATEVSYTTDDGFSYRMNLESLNASFCGYYGNATEIVIPESFTCEGLVFKVTSLGNECFYGCKSLRSVDIPSSVTSLGNHCFRGCSSLTSIEIPSSVTSLGNYCFLGCSSLTSVNIPSSVTSLRDYCFRGCSSLTSIEIPSSVTSLGVACFAGCSSLTS
ncbi:MAG: leucine-rich repeat domain-containing protein, partial [Bacteroidaceae bacterium]|nr:leucine-rich repeat domain-containing protein [Bacteroidaceae bacterium]